MISAKSTSIFLLLGTFVWQSNQAPLNAAPTDISAHGAASQAAMKKLAVIASPETTLKGKATVENSVWQR